VVLRSIDTTPRWYRLMVRTRTSICFVHCGTFGEPLHFVRNTAKPRPASPAMDA